MHVVCEDYHLYYDMIDTQTGKPVEWKDGAVGEKILTSLEWEAAPPFRYASGDIIQIFTRECECGWGGIRVKVIGRVDDMLIVKGINVFPSAIRNMVNSFIPRVTGAFRIVLDNPPPRVVPPLKLKIEMGRGLGDSDIERLNSELQEKMSDNLRFRPAIEFAPPRKPGEDLGESAALREAIQGEFLNPMMVAGCCIRCSELENRKSEYIETTVVSYFTARPSREIVIAGHQEATRDLWPELTTRYETYISALSYEKAGKGDPDQARIG